MIMTNKNYNKLVFEAFIIKSKEKKTKKKEEMTVFVHQNKFFSKEYFGSSFRIILVVFYVRRISRHTSKTCRCTK